MEIVSAFGPLKAYHFAVNDELNEPCAFLEVQLSFVTYHEFVYVSFMLDKL